MAPLPKQSQIQYFDSISIPAGEHFKLPGEHNRENLRFCYSMIQQFYPQLVNSTEWQQAVSSFTGVAHRLEHIFANGSLKIFNDAKSTNWDATEKAVGTFKEETDLYLIVGGQVRGRGEDTDHYGKLLGPGLKKQHLMLTVKEKPSVHAIDLANLVR